MNIQIPKEWLEGLVEKAKAINGLTPWERIVHLLGYIDSAKSFLEEDKTK